MNSLKILPNNKTVVFYCPFEGNNCLVRTGTVDDTAIISFFNSILYSCSRTFKDMNKDDKIKLINKVKNIIFEKINKKLWDTDGLIIFKNLFKESIIDFYNFINTTQTVKNAIVKKIGRKLIKDKKDFELFRIITDILPAETFIIDEDDILSVESYKKNIILNIKLYLQDLSILSQINEDKADHIIKSISEFVFSLMEEVEFNSFKNYNYHSESINNIIVDTVMEYFNYNIYFINSETRVPYIVNSFNNFININSIILLNINDDHFEAVGKLTHENNVIREFVSTDPLIFKINSIISSKSIKEKINDEEKEEYPEIEKLKDEEKDSTEEYPEIEKVEEEKKDSTEEESEIEKVEKDRISEESEIENTEEEELKDKIKEVNSSEDEQ